MKANINGKFEKRGKSLNESQKKLVETVAKAIFANPISFYDIKDEKTTPPCGAPLQRGE